MYSMEKTKKELFEFIEKQQDLIERMKKQIEDQGRFIDRLCNMIGVPKTRKMEDRKWNTKTYL